MTASAALVGATVSPTELQVVVEYTSDIGIATASLGTGDVSIGRQNQTPVVATLRQVVPNLETGSVRAVYAIPAPGGAWDPSDDGPYATRLLPLQVRESNNAPVPSGEIGVNNLRFTALQAAVLSTTVRASDWLINVAFSNAPVLLSSLGGGDITVRGPDGYQQSATLAQAQTLNGSLVATYRVAAPGSAWDAFETGQYTVSLNGGEVRDATGAAMFGAQLSQHSLWFNAPRAELRSTALAAGELRLDVAYTSTSHINAASLGAGDLLLRRIGGGESTPVTLASVAGSGVSRVATYVAPAPGGSWDPSDNAVYELLVREGEVSGVNGGVVPAHTLASLGLWIDPHPATVLSAEVEHEGSGRNRWLDVRARLRRDLLVAEPVPGAVLADITTPTGEMLAGVVRTVDHRSAVETIVTLRVVAPDRFFSFADNGEYGLTVRAGVVLADDVPVALPVETNGFTLDSLSAPRVEFLVDDAAADRWRVTLRMTDDSGFGSGAHRSFMPIMSYTFTPTLWDAGPFNKIFEYDTGMIRRAGGAVEISASAGYRTWESMPYASWRMTGDYRVWVLPAVLDSTNEPIGYGEFETRHLEFPYIAATIGSTALVGNRFTATVHYEPRGSLSASSFRPGDLLLRAPNGNSTPLQLVGVTPHPGGAWTVQYGADLAENVTGSHELRFNPGRVTDSLGDTLPDVEIAELELDAVNASLATETRTSSAWYVTVRYDTVSGLDEATLDTADLVVAERPDMVSGGHSIQRRAGVTFVTYRFDAPGGSWDVSENGTYTLRVLAGSVASVQGWLVAETVIGSRTFTTFNAPAVSLAANDSSASTWTIDVSYQGLGGINTASLGADDLSLTRGSTSYTLTLVDVTLVSGRTVARYRVNPRASGWTAADNGSYTLRVNANSIRGADGTYATARTLATFTAVRG